MFGNTQHAFTMAYGLYTRGWAELSMSNCISVDLLVESVCQISAEIYKSVSSKPRIFMLYVNQTQKRKKVKRRCCQIYFHCPHTKPSFYCKIYTNEIVLLIVVFISVLQRIHTYPRKGHILKQKPKLRLSWNKKNYLRPKRHVD